MLCEVKQIITYKNFNKCFKTIGKKVYFKVKRGKLGSPAQFLFDARNFDTVVADLKTCYMYASQQKPIVRKSKKLLQAIQSSLKVWLILLNYNKIRLSMNNNVVGCSKHCVWNELSKKQYLILHIYQKPQICEFLCIVQYIKNNFRGFLQVCCWKIGNLLHRNNYQKEDSFTLILQKKTLFLRSWYRLFGFQEYKLSDRSCKIM